MTDRQIDQPNNAPARRVILKSAAVVGVAVPFLAACASDSGTPSADSSPSTTPTGSGQSSTAGGAGSGGGGGKDPGQSARGGADVIAETSEIPEGGGVILDDPGIVLTQPSPGTFKGFSPICTHQGCTVASVADGTINCPCHGSSFSIADGSVVGGPAPAPLPAMQIAVNGADISLA